MAVRRLSHRDAAYRSATAHGSGAATMIHRDKPASVTAPKSRGPRRAHHEPATHPSMSAGRRSSQSLRLPSFHRPAMPSDTCIHCGRLPSEGGVPDRMNEEIVGTFHLVLDPMPMPDISLPPFAGASIGVRLGRTSRQLGGFAWKSDHPTNHLSPFSHHSHTH